MQLYRKLFWGGLILVLGPIFLLIIESKLLDCIEQTKILPLLLEFLDKKIELLGFLIPIGLCVLLVSFVLRERLHRKSIFSIVLKTVALVMFVLVMGTVYLASLNTARSKGPDAFTKSVLAGMRSQGELYYDTHNNSYAGVCNSPEFVAFRNTIQDYLPEQGFLCQIPQTRVTCIDTKEAYAASAKLIHSSSHWCVDSTGKSSLGRVDSGMGIHCINE